MIELQFDHVENSLKGRKELTQQTKRNGSLKTLTNSGD